MAFGHPSSNRSSLSLSSVSSAVSPTSTQASFSSEHKRGDSFPELPRQIEVQRPQNTCYYAGVRETGFETQEEALIRRAQEEQAAIEALDVYLAMQTKRETRNAAEIENNYGRRSSSPAVQYSLASAAGPTSDSIQVCDQAAIGNKGLRLRRSEVCLRSAHFSSRAGASLRYGHAAHLRKAGQLRMALEDQDTQCTILPITDKSFVIPAIPH